MRKMLNTLYVTSPDAYLSLEGETIKITLEKDQESRFPLLNFESIVTHGRPGVSPALLGKCREMGIPISFLTPNGRFMGRVYGEYRGNVLLRKHQYRVSDSERDSCLIARNFIFAKTHNQKWMIERMLRDHSLRFADDRMKSASEYMSQRLPLLRSTADLDILRAEEGKIGQVYFSVFDDMILQQKESFKFDERNRRPPLDPVNALLSYLYIILCHDVASALESVGLDPYVGFLHRDRPGRMSLALDVMEELRCIFVDRLILTMINRREITNKDFNKREDGAIQIKDESRKQVLITWQSRKADMIEHPFLNEKIEWGCVPYVQALLLSRFLRGDLSEYPSFLYRV